jgi:hypothetical protein
MGKTDRWRKEIAKFDRNVKLEECRNRKAIYKLKSNKGHTDGADNDIYSVNSLSGDPNLERELKLWRKAIADFRKIGD